MLKLRAIAALVFASLCTSTAFAQPPQKAAAPPPATQPAPSALPSTPGKPDYSQEPFVIEQYHTRVRFENDGTGRRELFVRIRVQSEAGVQQLGQLVLGYNSANERLEVDSLQVRKADGSATSAPASAVQDMTAPVTRDAPVYTDYRQKHVTVPGLRPGETLQYHIATHIHTPLAPGQFWLEYDFLKDAIVLDERLEVSVPQGRAIKLKTQPGVDPEVAEEGNRRTYRWKSSNLKRETEDEAKPKKKPKNKPEVPAIQLTTFQSWEEVGRWYAALERPRAVPTDAVRTKAEELVRGRATEAERIEALYDFVAKNFRYVSLSFGVGRYQPHAASEVLTNQYGDCKDKQTLLAALAQAIGLRAYPVLIHSSRKIDPDVPSPLQFDHAISVVAAAKDWIWLDTTTEVAPFRLLSANLRHKQALVIPTASGQAPSSSTEASTASRSTSNEPDPDGAPRLVETPADLPFPATQRVDVDGQVSELGKLTAAVRYTLRGDNELLLRMAFRRTPQNQWKQLGQLLAYSDGFRGEVSEVKASDPAATREPLQVEYRITQPNYFDWSRKKSPLTLPLPAIGLPDAPESEDSSDEKPEPIELGTALDVTTRVQLELPPKYAARAPVPVAVMRDYAEYRSSYKVEGSRVTAERRLRFRLRELSATRTPDYLAFARAVRTDEAQTLALESTAVGAPAIPETAKAEELYESGMSAFKSGNYRAAVELLERVGALEPNHKSAWNDLGSAYLALNRLEDAVKALRKQIAVNPYDEFAYNNLGRALWQQQKYDDAIRAFQKQIEVSPLDRWAHGNLGALYAEQRKYSEAVPELEKAIVLTPDNPSLHVSLGQAYLNLEQGDKALAAFEKAVEVAPAPPVWNNVAYQLALKKVHLERAQQYAESAVTSTAAALRNTSLDRLAVSDVVHVAALAAYWDTLGWVHFQKGDLDTAEKYIRAAWLLAQAGEVGDHLGQIYQKRGKKQDAVHTYTLALAATRPLTETRQHLADLVGSDDKVPPKERTKAGEELSALRTVKLSKLRKESASAEFFVLLAPSAGDASGDRPTGASPAGASVEDVKFVSGSEKLRPLAGALRSTLYPVEFPDATPTKLVRRGLLSCSAETSDCVFVLLLPSDVRAVD